MTVLSQVNRRSFLAGAAAVGGGLSLGLAFSLSSAVTAMIMPLWQ